MIRQLKPTAPDLRQSGYAGIRISPSQPAPAAARPGTGPTSVSAGNSAVIMPHAAATPPADDGLATLSLSIPFAPGSADLLPPALAALQRLGTALTSPDLASYRFRVEGHTDTVGTAEYNRELSAHRAAVVVQYLEQQFGVTPSRLDPVGLGFDRPAVPTPPQTSEPRNRRVQIVNVGS